MAKKRRRSKKRKSEVAGEFFDDEENAPLAAGKDYVDEDVFRLLRILGIRLRRSLFKEGGFRCTRCGFKTKKLGTAGRNSLRAHLKKHVREDRAGRHLRSLVWPGLLLVMAALAYVLYTMHGAVAVAVESWARNLTWGYLVGPGLAAAATTVSLAMITFAFLYTRKHLTRWRIAFHTSLIPASAIFLAQVALVSGVVQLEVAWPWYLSGLLPIGALGLTRKEVGLTALNVSRRSVKPRHYIKMFRALTADGDMRIMEIQLEIEEMIRKGQLDTRNLEFWQKQALVTLEIMKIEERN